MLLGSEKQPLHGTQQGGAGGTQPQLLPALQSLALAGPASQKPEGKELACSLQRSAGSMTGTKWKWRNK